MKPSANARRPAAKSIWLLVIVLALTTGGVVGTKFWQQQTALKAQPAGDSAVPGYTTRPVRTGDITLAASGSVTLVAGQEEELAFTVSGTVAELNGMVGDTVKKGQVLAQLDNLEALEADIQTAEQDLLSAQQELAAFQAKAPANLANAQLKVIEAQEALEDAQGSAVQKDWARCDAETKDELWARYDGAVDQLTALGDGGGGADYYLTIILPQKQVVDQALAAYQACAGYTEYQVASSQINVTAAEAQLKQAQKALDTLIENGGLEPAGLAAAENQVATAQQALEDARDHLDGATLKAPFDGTILSVAGKAGDTVEVTTKNPSVTFITISDLAHPLLEFSIDETDMDMVARGEAAEVIFDAFEDRIFTGSVVRVDPTITSTDGVATVTGLIELDLTGETDVPAFPKNLSGSVNIIQASVKDALLIPIEALREQSDGTYGVYIIGAGGKPALKTVAVGLKDVASVEIKSGLSAEDIVVTSKMP